MSGKPHILNQTPGLYFVPEARNKRSPIMEAIAEAAKEARQKGETPEFFSGPKGTDRNPEDQPTTPSNWRTNPSERQYEKLSPEEKERVLSEFEKWLSDPRTAPKKKNSKKSLDD
jgi:hypothetical protein